MASPKQLQTISDYIDGFDTAILDTKVHDYVNFSGLMRFLNGFPHGGPKVFLRAR